MAPRSGSPLHTTFHKATWVWPSWPSPVASAAHTGLTTRRCTSVPRRWSRRRCTWRHAHQRLTGGPLMVRLALGALAWCGLLLGQGHRDGGTLESRVDERRRKLTGGRGVRGGLRWGNRLDVGLGAALPP
jgi:hypothetical protein